MRPARIAFDTMSSDDQVTPPGTTIDRTAVRSVLEEYPLRLAILFGSHVDGTPTPQSDVDVGVLFEEDCSASERREMYLDLHSTIATALGTENVDVTLLDDVPPSVGRQALQAYEVLVGEPTLAEQLRERYEATAPLPSHGDLVTRLDESLAALDTALDVSDTRRANSGGE
jgi:predicted nucleotidyltransferase